MLRKLKLALPAISLMAVLYYADEFAFAPPIIAVTAWLGMWGLIFLIPAYWLFDYLLGSLALGIVIRRSEGIAVNRPGVLGWLLRGLQRWFNSFASAMPAVNRKLSPEGARRVRVVGFVFASYFGTAFLTMPAMYLLGQRKYLRVLTAASAAIYAVTYVGKYALGTFVVIFLVKVVIGWL